MPSQIDYDAPYRGLLSFDADGDGKTTFKEYTDAMEHRFSGFDTDGDGVISRAEFDAYWQRSGLPAPKVAEIQPAFEEKVADECAVPKPAKDVKFVLFNGYRPVALSTAAIGSQDKETRTTKVIIEPGPEPLYLVMIAWDRVVWQFEGAVERVKRVILAEAGVNEREGSPVGATGLAKEVVTVSNSGRCGLFWVNMNKKNLRDTRANQASLRPRSGRHGFVPGYVESAAAVGDCLGAEPGRPKQDIPQSRSELAQRSRRSSDVLPGGADAHRRYRRHRRAGRHELRGFAGAGRAVAALDRRDAGPQ
jgi:hypothetical protein